eukprot:Gb_13514 [translate_table: standard]
MGLFMDPTYGHEPETILNNMNPYKHQNGYTLEDWETSENTTDQLFQSLPEMGALDRFRKSVTQDPNHTFEDWKTSPDGPCGWRGVTCNTESMVVELSLPDAYLFGHLDSAIAQLSRLQRLNISGNRFIGNVPQDLYNCTELVSIDLSDNQFEGTINESIKNLKNLQVLDVGNNHIAGVFPIEITNLTNLQYLNLSHNNFSGQIPGQITRLKNLVALDLSSNGFKGSLPENLPDLEKLIELNLAENVLSGGVPLKYSSFSSLEMLNLRGNSLDGDVPELVGCLKLKKLILGRNNFQNLSWNGSVKGLEMLDLSRNAMTGPINPALFALEKLEYLDLSENTLTGAFPMESVTKFEVMEWLNLAYNEFTGNLPKEIGIVVSLDYLNVSGNNFSGPIPWTLENLTKLETLDLSMNKFDQSIPNSISALTRLKNFFVNGNRLSGRVPDSDVLRRFDKKSFANNSGLCGWIGPRCNGDSNEAEPPDWFWYPDNTFWDILDPPSTKKKALHMRQYAIILCVIAIVLGIGIVTVILYCCRPDLFHGRDGLKHNFSFQALRVATGNFSEENFMGTGSRYRVYRGLLKDGRVIAVKVIKEELCDEMRESFVHECETLVQMRHENLVSVLGWCDRKNFVCIVVEFMRNGSLENWLLDKDHPPSWSRRLEVAMDIAFALAYLHHDWPNTISDLRSRSILLDSAFRAHISDFQNCCKYGNSEDESLKSSEEEQRSSAEEGDYQSSPSSSISASKPRRRVFGKCEPQSRSHTNTEVYSYGVLLLEVMTNKRPTKDFPIKQHHNIIAWVRQACPDSAWDIMDPVIKNTAHKPVQPLQLMDVALICTTDLPCKRPTMEEVVAMLEKVRNLDWPLQNQPHINSSSHGIQEYQMTDYSSPDHTDPSSPVYSTEYSEQHQLYTGPSSGSDSDVQLHHSIQELKQDSDQEHRQNPSSVLYRESLEHQAIYAGLSDSDHEISNIGSTDKHDIIIIPEVKKDSSLEYRKPSNLECRSQPVNHAQQLYAGLSDSDQEVDNGIDIVPECSQNSPRLVYQQPNSVHQSLYAGLISDHPDHDQAQVSIVSHNIIPKWNSSSPVLFQQTSQEQGLYTGTSDSGHGVPNDIAEKKGKKGVKLRKVKKINNVDQQPVLDGDVNHQAHNDKDHKRTKTIRLSLRKSDYFPNNGPSQEANKDPATKAYEQLIPEDLIAEQIKQLNGAEHQLQHGLLKGLSEHRIDVDYSS